MANEEKVTQPQNTEEPLHLKALEKNNAAVQVENQPSPGNVPPSGDKKSGAGKKRKVKKGNRNITIIFYTCYFFMIAVFAAGMFYADNLVDDFLINFQNSQPTARSEDIFNEYFAAPDWEKLYQMAGLEGTLYEDATVYAAYMNEKVGTQKLTYAETSAGLSGGRKYLLKLGNETLGYFTLKDMASSDAELADWQLGEISLNITSNKSVRVQTNKGSSVAINGVPLDSSHIVQVSTTLASNYLPEGVRAPTTCVYLLEGLMYEPQVTVTDAEGNIASVVYDEQAGMYIEQTIDPTISDEQMESAMNAARTYARYMIEEATKDELCNVFDPKSKICKTITSMTMWMQGHNGYKITDEEVTQYCRYSDKYFSVRVTLSLNVTRKDNTVKKYSVNSTLFFKNTGKKWVVFDMTNADVQTPITKVRISFMLDDNVVFTNMFPNDIGSLDLPTISAPEGKAFAGWFRQEFDENGTKRYVQVFPPAEEDTITFPAGTILEPMTLYALFEDN